MVFRSAMPMIADAHPAAITPEASQAAGGTVLAGGLARYGLALLYALALCYAYDVLSIWWAYFGFTYKLQNDQLRYIACAIAALPAILLHPRPRTFAEAAAWFLYILVFVPCMIVPVMQYYADIDRLIYVFTMVFSGCVLFLLLVRGEVRRIAVPTVSPRLFWSFLWALWVGLLLLIIISFGSSFQFVGADSVYTQRFIGAEANTNPIVRYSIALLGSAIDPFLIAYGFHSRRYWIAGAGTAAQIVLFGTLAARAVLLSPFIVVGAYFLADRRGVMRGNLMFAGLLVVFVLTLPLLARYNPVAGGLNEIISLFYLRTLLIAGATFGVYDQFFLVYPLTYFSNSNIVSLFIEYPYGDLSVGQAVQQMLTPSTTIDIPELNANFLATDGIAAVGVLGVPVISAVAALALRTMSRFITHGRTMVMVAAATGFITSMANSSLLTSLITGGGVLLTALVCLAPLDRG
jgi:hypothetical protein